MSRISNDLAQQIAYKLTEKSKKSVDQLHVDYRELATQIYEERTPNEVVVCFKKHHEFIGTCQSLRVHEHGFHYETISTTRPIISPENYNANLKLASKEGDKLIRAKRKWEKAKKDYEDLKEETKQALLALKTFNNIRKELPEAAQYLPPPISNALVVNFTSLKARLKKQQQAEAVIKTPTNQATYGTDSYATAFG